LTESNSDKLANKNLIGYSLGAIPAGLLAFVFTLKYVEFFYNDLKLFWVYFIIGQIIYMIVNAVNDPLLGQLSDQTNREKWGSRRLIYIRYGGPIWALTFIMVWTPWSTTNQLIIFLHYVISICLFDTMLTLVILVWMALLPEMTANVDERNKANFLSLLFGVIGVVPFILILMDMKTTSQSFLMLNIFIAIFSSIILLLVSFLCEEKPEFQKDEAFPLIKSVKETIKSKSFLLFIGYNFCGVFIGSLLLSYLFVYILILGGDIEALIFFFIIYIFIGFSSNVLCMGLRKKHGMRKIILTFGLLKAFGTFALFFFMLIPGLEYLIWIGFMWTTFFGGYSVFTTGGLMPQSIDEDELKNGTRREGMFLGVNALITKPANSIGPILATIILVSFGYIQGSDVQSESALLGIKILFLIVPAVATLISLVFIYFYPLHGERLQELERELKILHDQKKQRLLTE